MNNRIRPIELTLEFRGSRCVADHHRTRRGTLVETRGGLIPIRYVFGFVDPASVRKVVAAVLEQCRQHATMFLRIIDAERTLFHIGAARSHRIVIVETLLPLGFFQQRLMRDR